MLKLAVCSVDFHSESRNLKRHGAQRALGDFVPRQISCFHRAVFVSACDSFKSDRLNFFEN